VFRQLRTSLTHLALTTSLISNHRVSLCPTTSNMAPQGSPVASTLPWKGNLLFFFFLFKHPRQFNSPFFMLFFMEVKGPKINKSLVGNVCSSLCNSSPSTSVWVTTTSSRRSTGSSVFSLQRGTGDPRGFLCDVAEAQFSMLWDVKGESDFILGMRADNGRADFVCLVICALTSVQRP